MMNARGIGYLIVTKSALVADKSYMRVMDPQLAHIQISVTSTSDEPNFLGERASKPSDRLRAAESLSKAGFDVSLRVSPYLPELVDIEALKASNVDKCLVEFLRVNGFIRGWLKDAGRDTREYTHKSGGYRHLPLARKQALIEPFRAAFGELTVCEDVPSHYDYWQKNVNHDPDDCCNLRKEKA
jgi:DNA repair photolyase